MRSRAIAEGVSAAIVVAAGIALFVIAPHLVRSWAFNVPGTTDVALEPAFFPRLAAVLMSIAAATVLVTIPRREGTLPLSEASWSAYGKVGLGIAGILVFLLLINILGFVVSSALFIVIATWLSGYRRPIIIAVTALLVPAALRLVFRYGLHVGLPTGFFF